MTAAQPGWTATDLQRTARLARLLNPIFAMKPADGAMPTMRAATDPGAEPGSYWGPAGLFGLNGPPVRARISKHALDEAAALRLFDLSEKLSGVFFASLSRSALPAAF